MEFKVELKYNGHTLGVEGKITPGIPAELSGHPDTWNPAEGATIELTSAYIFRRNSKTRRECVRKLSKETVLALNDRDGFIEKVYDAAREAGY